MFFVRYSLRLKAYFLCFYRNRFSTLAEKDAKQTAITYLIATQGKLRRSEEEDTAT